MDRLFTTIAALAMLALPTAPVAARQIAGQLTGTVTSYETFVNPEDVMAAFPLGTPVSARFRFDVDAFHGPATGTVKIGAAGYTVTDVDANGGIVIGDQIFGFTDLGLTGPTVASGDPDYLPGTVFFEFGVPYPDPLGTTVATYPYGSIAVGYELASGFGFGIDRANLTFTAGSISAVPEAATWLELVAGFAAIGVVRRRSGRAAVA